MTYNTRLSLIIAFVFSIVSVCQAQNLPAALSSHACSKNIQRQILERCEATVLNWSPVGSDSFSILTYRSPLIEFKIWTEISFDKVNHDLTMRFYSLEKIETIKFSKTCEVKTDASSAFAFLNNPFNDDKIQELVSSGNRGFIYVWSPGMPYSVTDYEKYKRLAKTLNFSFHALLNPSMNQFEAQSSLKKLEIKDVPQYLGSLELYMRNATLHYPSLFIYSQKKLYPHRIVGILKNDDIKAIIQRLENENSL